MMKNKGFTLIEVVVVLAVVAILAAILTPTIVKNMDDAKFSRAENEVQVIAAALGSFYKDLGRWPTSDGTGLADSIQLLYGPGDTPGIQGGGVAQEQFWLNDGTGWGAGVLDSFANQLVQNLPGGGGGTIYPDDTTVPRPELRWKGPYIVEVKADPWGSHYSCNIWYTFSTTTNFVGVWSAGPDRTSNTDAVQVSTAVTIGGDDVVFRLK
jgi:prepilin-type N-terminal cleavage/methylation domain-containing protein